jgi:ribonuclease BN (tRNA processing enzyme)
MSTCQADGAFTVTAWGCRGSYPVCAREFLEYGGNTTCYGVCIGKRLIILDAGTGIINLSHHLMKKRRKTSKPVVATLFISHTHHDHTEGFPFFAPLHLARSQLYLYGPSTSYVDIEDALAQGLAAPYFPVGMHETKSVKVIRPVDESTVVRFYAGIAAPQAEHVDVPPRKGETLEAEVRVKYGTNHPKNGVHHYRIESGGRSLVYATDTEGFLGGDQRLIDFTRDADLLIHDAQYLPGEYTDGAPPKQGWGHSTYEMACEVAKAAGVDRLLLHHHDPQRTDKQVEAIQSKAKRLFRNCEAVREGTTYEV